jgi:uncharacterized protein (TIGR03435 family)
MRSPARVTCYLPFAATVWSQVADPTFEAATIKRSAPPTDGRTTGQMIRDPGRVSYSYVTLQNLFAQAYRVKNFQIVGPNWLDSERFDVVATLPKNTSDDQLREMLQTLLRERFRLAFHRESKAMSAYVLLPGKGGPKLSAVGERIGGVRTTSSANRRHLSGKVSMPYFAGLLSNMLDRPVVDMTGLTGVYDLDLEWSVYDATGGATDDPPSLFTVLQEKLGLRLESRKAPADLYVIDHVERVPIGN